MASKAIAKRRTVTRYVRRARRRSNRFTLPLAPIAGLAVGIMPAIEPLKQGNYDGAFRQLQYRYTPYDPWAKKFSVNGMMTGALPLVLGVLVHRFIGGKLGVNRALAQAGVPLIRI